MTQEATGHAYFTLSTLIDGAQISGLLEDFGGGRAAWDQDTLRDIEHGYADSGELQRAIGPMFDDISDRERNLFIKDFLLDTPNAPGAAEAGEHNMCARISLALPGADLNWTTEGALTQLALASGPAAIRFDDVRCRAFWMAHSNDALSYHLSFEVPFVHGIGPYYGLAMLQKAFFPTEGTDWVLGEAGWRAAAEGEGEAAPTLMAFMERLFEAHVLDLFEALRRPRPGDSAPARFGALDVARFAAHAWQRLVLQPEGGPAGEKQAVGLWQRAAARRRLLVLLRDRRSFDLIDAMRGDDSPLKDFAALSADAGRYGEAEVLAHLQRHAGTKDADAVSQRGAELLCAVFLSGFFQNIVDFLEQDGLEVFDGLSPLYPDDEGGAANEGYLLYATPKVIYEVVRSSRSLDGAGRAWLGTCPYLFLVHITAFHNESIVRAYEERVTRLTLNLERLGVKAGAIEHARFGEAFRCIREFRLETFERVHKHLSFNIFRYETEKAFFRGIEVVRGVDARKAYWDGVLEHLTETIDALKDDRMARYGNLISVLGGVLAVLGLTQLWLSIFKLEVDLPLGWNLAGLTVLIGALGIGVWRLLLRWRRAER